MFCPDLNNNQIRKEFTELSNIVGEDLAYYIYNKQAKEVDGQMTSMLFRTDYNGDANPEFENVLKLKEINNNEVKAIEQMVNSFFVKNKENEIDLLSDINNNPKENNIQYQNNTDQSDIDYIASEKTIRDLAERMADRIGLKVRYESDRTLGYKGKLEADTAVINLAHATLDTPIHEILGHPVIRALKTGTTQNKQLYNNLLKELETGKGKEVLDRIKRDYQYKGEKVNIGLESKLKEKIPANFTLGGIKYSVDSDYEGEIFYNGVEEISPNEYYLAQEKASQELKPIQKYTLEEQQEEAIVELLGLYTANRLDKIKDGKLISLLKGLLKEMKSYMKSLFNAKEVNIDELPDNMSIGNLADLLAYSNNKLILPGNEVIYTTPDNQTFKTYQEASNHISELTKLSEVKLDLIGIDRIKEIKNVSEIKEIDFLTQEGTRYVKKNGNWYYSFNMNKPLDNDTIIIAYNTKDLTYSTDEDTGELFGVDKRRGVDSFISKNKEYEQSKEIIEEWKKVNNIKYDPKEVYSRGQGFYSVVGAYSDFDVGLMFQNLLAHIEDNKKSGGEFTISAFTKPIDKKINHLEGGEGKIKFKIFPKYEDIKWAANSDVYSGSVWDASEKVNKDKKSEIIGVSYTKAPSLNSINLVQPNLADIIDKLAHHHNELGIELTGNNFRLEYDDNVPYSTKKLLNKINGILDNKFGKLVEPKIENNQKQPTQTNESLKESIGNIANKIGKDIYHMEYNSARKGFVIYGSMGMSAFSETFETKEKAKEFLNKKYPKKEYTSQAEINTKVAALKYGQRKFPRSLIRSEVVKTNDNVSNQFDELMDLPFQKVPKKHIQLKFNFPVTVNDVKETMSKASLTDESTNLYAPETKAKNITQSEYDKLPGKEYLNSFKHVIEYYRSGAEKLVNRYNDATMVETNINGKQAFKVVIYKPRNLVDNLDEGIITKEMPEDVQKSIDRMNNMISAFKLKLAQKTPRYAEIKAQISLLESKISKLEEKYSEGELFKVMKSDEAMIRSNLVKFEEQLSDTDLSSEQLSNVMDALIDTSYYINGWVDVCDFVNTNDIVQEKQIINLQGNIKIHNKKYRDLLADTFARYANSNTFKTDTSREALLAPVADVMRTKANYFSIGESEVLLLQLMDDLISKNASDRNEENIKTTTEVSQWEANLKKNTGLRKDEIKESFKQKLEDGTWTGNLIGRYKQEFYNKRRSLRDAAKKNKSNWPAFYKWIKENSTEIKESELTKINKTPVEELGDVGIFSKAEVDIQKSLLDQYNKDKLAYVELIATSDIFISGDLVVNEDGSYKYSNSEEIELEFYEEIEIWKNAHSPFAYIKGDIQFRRQSLGNNYLINEKPSEEWSDPRFKTIKDNEHLYSFYRYIKDTFKEGNKQLPFFNNLQENYLPEKQKRLIERVANNHILAGKWGEISDDLKISMTDNLARPLDEKIAIGSREIKGIRTTMMGDNLDIDQKEDDIFKILTEYNKMVTNYKFKHQIEPMTMAATDIIDGIKDANNTFKPIVNAKDALQYRIDAYLYNYSKDVEGRTGKKVYLTKDKAKLNALKNQLSNEEITKSEFNEAKNKLGREITWSANTDSLITLSYLKQMGLPNFISPTVNLAFGFVSNMTYAAGGKDFSEKEAFKATILLQSLALGNYSHKSKELNKVFAFMDRLGVLGDIHEGNVGEKSFMEYATYLQSHAEKINQGAMMTAMLKTQKLKDKNGKEVKVFDAFKDVNGEIVWDIDKMGEQEKVPMDRIYGENQQGVNLSALSSYMAAVNRKIHGDYKTPMMIKKGAVMRAVMQYKRWIPQAVKHRFGKLDFDQDLLGEDGKRGRAIKGRYRSFVSSSTIDGLELKATESMLIMLKGLALQGKAFKNLSEVDRINMMRNLREIQFIVAMIGSVALLQGMFGDDDDNWALNMAINTLTKTQSDMAFFLNPNAMGQITNNMIPAISTLGDLITVGTYAFKLLYGDVYYQNGPWKNHSKLGVSLLKANPFFTPGAVKLINYGDRVFNQNY